MGGSSHRGLRVDGGGIVVVNVCAMLMLVGVRQWAFELRVVVVVAQRLPAPEEVDGARHGDRREEKEGQAADGDANLRPITI